MCAASSSPTLLVLFLSLPPSLPPSWLPDSSLQAGSGWESFSSFQPPPLDGAFSASLAQGGGRLGTQNKSCPGR